MKFGCIKSQFQWSNHFSRVRFSLSFVFQVQLSLYFINLSRLFSLVEFSSCFDFRFTLVSYWVLVIIYYYKKINTNPFSVCAGNPKKSAGFFLFFSICLNFLGGFWLDSACFDIFPSFSMIFRGYVNFSGIFGTSWIFLWISQVIFYLHFSTLFGDRKNWNKLELCPLWLCGLCCIFNSDFRSLIFCFNFILELGCLAVIYFLIFFSFVGGCVYSFRFDHILFL